ncbi:MAG: hypothetical protein GX800_03955 [Clostridiaceae bacterium]|jgi:hypothetical protein|nr:hypothetical protein [Clostridiaceae bacterium]
MNWRQEAVCDLERYEKQKQALDNISDRISILNDSYTSLKSASMDKLPYKADATRFEDAMLNNIVERQKLENTYKITRSLVRLTEKGLCKLNDCEKRVLELFYIRKQKMHVERLMEELGYEKTKIYSLREKALHDFTICMYGLLEC